MNSPPPVDNATPLKRPPGRPRKLDEFARREICAIIAAGRGISAAARYVGCAPVTIRREAQQNPEFDRALRRAFIAPELEAVNALRKAGGRNWRAAAWLLERTDPDRYGRLPLKSIRPDLIEKVIEQMIHVVENEVKDPDLESLREVNVHGQRDLWLAERDMFLNDCPLDESGEDGDPLENVGFGDVTRSAFCAGGK